jgi:hypothetical protein
MENNKYIDNVEYSKFIHKSRYSKYLPDKKRRENWGETLERWSNFWKTKYPQEAEVADRLINEIEKAQAEDDFAKSDQLLEKLKEKLDSGFDIEIDEKGKVKILHEESGQYIKDIREVVKEEKQDEETKTTTEETTQENEVDDLDFTATLDEDTETETTPTQSENVETPTTEPIKEITDEEYLDFVENDILTDDRLTEVAAKVRENKDLTPYEKRIAKGREKEISTINKKLEETEKENQRKEKVNTIIKI